MKLFAARVTAAAQSARRPSDCSTLHMLKSSMPMPSSITKRRPGRSSKPASSEWLTTLLRDNRRRTLFSGGFLPMIDSVEIGGRVVGSNAPVYIVAELSANHNQDFDQAVKLVHAAHDAGANAVKLQTYTPDSLTAKCDNKYFRIGKGTVWEGKTLYELYGEACTPWEWQPKLKQVAEELGLQLFSSPFDFQAVDFLKQIDMPAYKIASFEIVDLALIRYAAETGKPIILSTGMASLAEIGDAVRTVRATGNDEIVLLKCTSAYPASPRDMNLRVIPDLSQRFDVPVGLSDHTLATTVPVAAVALGACMIEKHLTLSRDVPGP